MRTVSRAYDVTNRLIDFGAVENKKKAIKATTTIVNTAPYNTFFILRERGLKVTCTRPGGVTTPTSNDNNNNNNDNGVSRGGIRSGSRLGTRRGTRADGLIARETRAEKVKRRNVTEVACSAGSLYRRTRAGAHFPLHSVLPRVSRVGLPERRGVVGGRSTRRKRRSKDTRRLKFRGDRADLTPSRRCNGECLRDRRLRPSTVIRREFNNNNGNDGRSRGDGIRGSWSLTPGAVRL